MKFNKNIFIGIFSILSYSFLIASSEKINFNLRMSHEIEELKIKNQFLEEEYKKLKKEYNELSIKYNLLEKKYFKILDENNSLKENINLYDREIKKCITSCNEEKKFLNKKIQNCYENKK